MKSKPFFASAWLFALKRRIAREIWNRVIPHLNQKADYDYPFHDAAGLWQAAHHGKLDAQLHLGMIEKAADRMPKPYGDTFKYIMYRDLNRRLAMYEELAWQSAQSSATPDPHLIAKPA